MPFRPTLKTYQNCFYLLLSLLIVSSSAHAQLKADFTTDKNSGCSPLTVSFTNTTTGGSAATTYKWDFGNGNTSALKNAGATYVPEKTYTVTLTATDGSASSTQTKQVTVYKKPTVDFSASPLKGCVPLPVSFTSNSTPGDGNIATYFWDFGDGITQQGAGYQQISHTYTSPQQASISLTATTNYGCYNTIVKPIVTISPALTSSFTKDKTVLCAITDAVMFTSTSTGSGTLNYLWDFGDGTTSTIASPSHTYNAKGNYSVKLTVSNADGCSITSSVQTINVANFAVDFSVPTSICKSTYVTFTDNSTPGYTNENWQVDGQYAYGYSYQFYSAGTHAVKLTATYGSCSLSATKQVSVKDIPAIQPFTINAASFCNPPVTVNFKDNTSGATTWSWSFGDYSSTIATTQAPSHVYNSQGYYYVNLAVTNANGCTASESQYLNISNPTIGITSDYDSYYSNCGSVTVNFKASPDTSIATYNWVFDDGATSTDAAPKHTFTAPGTYNVQLNYTTKGGCKGTVGYYSTITVYQKPKADFTVSSNTICGNSPVTFTDKSTGSFTIRNWNFGSNYENYYSGYYNDINPIIQYTDSGTYTVQLIVSNNGCRDTMTKVAYIKVTPPFPKINTPTYTCAGTRGLVKFTDASKYAQKWQWNFGDGSSQTFSSKQDTVPHTYTKTGTYKVVLTITNGSCTVSDSLMVYVLLKQSPVLSSTQSQICSSDALNITINNLEQNPYINSYTYYYGYSISNWQYGDGTLFPGYSSSSSYDWSTTYTGTINSLNPAEKSLRVILSSSNYNCNDTTNYISIKVNGPIAGFKITTNNVCFKNPVVFQDTSKGTNSIGIKTWKWNFGDGTSQTLTTGGTVSHLYASPGYYYPSLTVTDSGGCSSTASTNYYSNEAIVNGPQASFSYTPTTVIPTTTVYFYNNSNTQGVYNTQYSWTFGDGSAVSSSSYPSHTYPTIGVDTVTLIAADKTVGCADTAKKIIYVKNINTSFTYTASYINNNSCPPSIVKFQNTSTNTTSVSWDFGDGGIAGNQNFPSHTYLNAGVYKVTLYGYGIYGSKDSTIDSVTVKGPYAKITADTLSGCLAQTIKLNAIVKNAASITWDFADGTLIQTKDTFATHAYLTPGLYTPSLILKDNNGCPSTSSLPDTIVIDTLNVSLRLSPNHFCDSAIVVFNPDIYSLASQMNRPLLYQWDFGTGNPADTSNSAAPVFDYNKLGTYYVNLKLTSPYGCTKQTKDSIVIVQGPKGSITGPSGICEGATAAFSGAAAIINSTTSWSWNFYNGNKSALQNPPVQTFADAGTYNVSLIVTNNGCMDTSISILTVHPKPDINLTPKQASICQGKPVQLTAHDGTIYAWSSSTGSNYNGASINVKPSANTVYTVKVTNAFNCIDTDSASVVVALPFAMNAPADTTICNGKSVRLNVSGANSYSWINTTTGLSNTQTGNPLATPNQTTTYTVVGYDAYQCFSNTASVKVTIEPSPTVNAGPSLEILAGTPIQLTATGSNDITIWNWQPADYLSCTACSSPVSTPLSAITYTVTAKNQFGCIDTGVVTINLICTQQYVYIPNAFTPNGDGKNDIFYIKGRGVKQIQSLQIFNRWGVMVFERMNFNIDDQSAGWDGTNNGKKVEPGSYVYLAKMQCDTGEPFEKKGTIIVIR